MKTTTIYILGLMLTLLISCNQEPTLQKYFVEQGNKPGFMTLDIAPTIIQTDSIPLTAEEKEALNSLHKFNILAFTANEKNRAQLKQEQEKVNALLKDEKYDELMHIGSGDRGASIHTIGEGDELEEVVVYVHQKETGLTVVRVLGENMNPNNIMTLIGLLQKGPIDSEQLKPLRDLMAPQLGK